MREKIARIIDPEGCAAYEQAHHSGDLWLQTQKIGALMEARRKADAVLDALMEPTETMQVVGGTKLEEIMFGGDEDATGVIFTDCGVVFRSMIKAAKEGK